jgi:hypothetical protein
MGRPLQHLIPRSQRDSSGKLVPHVLFATPKRTRTHTHTHTRACVCVCVYPCVWASSLIINPVLSPDGSEALQDLFPHTRHQTHNLTRTCTRTCTRTRTRIHTHTHTLSLMLKGKRYCFQFKQLMETHRHFPQYKQAMVLPSSVPFSLHSPPP